MVERTYSRRRPRDVRRDAERLERALGTQGEDVLVPRLKELVSSYFLVFFFERKRQKLCPSFKGKELREYKQRSETGQATPEHTQREAKPHTLNTPG
jgi:hypothetical protein